MNDNTFIIIPPHIRADTNLTIQEKMVFGLINGLTGKYGYCFARNSYIGEQIGLSDGRVSKHIAKLVQKGYVSLEIKKIKKNERTGQTGEKYGTIRHIYVYQKTTATSPLVENDQPPLVENDQSIVKKHSIEREGNALSLNSEEVSDLAEKVGVKPDALLRASDKYLMFCEDKNKKPTQAGLKLWLTREKWDTNDYSIEKQNQMARESLGEGFL